MNRNSWIYTGLLFISLSLVVLLASRGTVQSVIDEGDIQLGASSAKYQGDEIITFHAILEFADLEQAVIEDITLTFTDNSPVNLNVRLPLPLIEGSVTLTGDDGVDGLNPMTATIRFVDVTELDGPVVTPTPQTFKGISQNARIEIDIEWDPDQDAQVVTGDYAVKLILQLGGAAKEKESDVVNFSITPVTLEVLAPQKIAPNSLFEAIVQAGGVQNLSEVSFQLIYDDKALEFVDAQPEICSLTFNPIGSGVLSIDIRCDPAETGTSLSLARISFKTIATINSIDTGLEIANWDIENPASQTIPSTVVGATVTVSPECGDVNGDGSLTIEDASDALRIAIGSLAPTATQVTVGNVDGKVGVSVIDAIMLLQHASGARQFLEDCGLAG